MVIIRITIYKIVVRLCLRLSYRFIQITFKCINNDML